MTKSQEKIQVQYTKPENPIEGTFYYDENTQKIMFFKDGQWVLIDNSSVAKDLCSMSLFDLNQSIISQLDPIDEDGIEVSADLISSWCDKEPDEHFMLLNNSLRYYTMFSARSKRNMEFNNLGDAVMTIATELGIVRSVSLLEDSSAIEIWIDYEDKGPQCFLLFPYDNGIVEYRR